MKRWKEKATTVNHEIATTLVNNFLKQVFVDHYFHADPHPGNILIHELRPDESAKQYATTKHHEIRPLLSVTRLNQY